MKDRELMQSQPKVHLWAQTGGMKEKIKSIHAIHVRDNFKRNPRGWDINRANMSKQADRTIKGYINEPEINKTYAGLLLSLTKWNNRNPK